MYDYIDIIMANIGDVFTVKERTNWLKALLALKITRDGLQNYVDRQFKDLQQHIVHTVQTQLNLPASTVCTSCVTANLLKCPTKNVCTKKNGTCTTIHDTPAKRRRKCPLKFCEIVRDEIIKNHRYTHPSWKNTSADSWSTNHWQIAKCFLPPEGYARVNSVQTTDFNGLISVILNCKLFDEGFSFAISSNSVSEPCLLTKARQISRDVRHCPDLTVTDDNLNAYITTFLNILSDKTVLAQDVNAQEAKNDLQKLQNDTLILANDKVILLLNDMQKIITTTYKDQHQSITQHTKTAMEELKRYTEKLEEDSKISIGKESESVKIELQGATDEGSIKLASETTGRIDQLKKATDDCTSRMEFIASNVIKGIALATEDEKNKLKAVASNIYAEHEKLKNELVTIARKGFESISDVTDVAKTFIKTTTDEEVIYTRQQPEIEKYKRDCRELLRRLKIYYEEIFSHVPICPLDPRRDENIFHFFVQPTVKTIDIRNQQEKGIRVRKYRDIFYTQGKPNQRIYIQGEAGVGKTTFINKIVLDWCRSNSYSKNLVKKSNIFQDLETIKQFQFMFPISLRNAGDQREMLKMIKEQILYSLYSESERDDAYKLVQKIIETEKCCLPVDGIDEWSDPKHDLVVPIVGSIHTQCTFLFTTRPWKMLDHRIKNSQIDCRLQIYGICSVNSLTEMLFSYFGKERPQEMRKSFMSHAKESSLSHLLSSPMMLKLLVSLWVEEVKLRGSMCEIYVIFIDHLLSKVCEDKVYFETPPVKCFANTLHVKPNIEMIESLAKAAFHFLFSSERQNSLVFSDKELSMYLSPSQKVVALKAGILSEKATPGLTSRISTFSFLHKSFQEFLATYHIARSNYVMETILEPLLRNGCKEDLDFMQLFIFLSGHSVMAANNMSHVMCSIDIPDLQTIIVRGFKEAKANQHTDINFKLRDFEFKEYLFRGNPLFSDINDINDDLQCILMYNKSNIRSLELAERPMRNIDIQEVLTCSRTSLETLKLYVECDRLDLTSCIHLKVLFLELYSCKESPTLTRQLGELKELEFLYLHKMTLSETIRLPNAIQNVQLATCRCTFMFLQKLIEDMSAYSHDVKCMLSCCYVISSQTEYQRSVDQTEFISSETSNLSLVVWGTCVDILPTLRGAKIKNLTVSGIEKMDPLIRIIHTLQGLNYISLCTVSYDIADETLLIPSHIIECHKYTTACLRKLIVALSRLNRLIKLAIDVRNVKLTIWSLLDTIEFTDASNVILDCYGDSRGLQIALQNIRFGNMRFYAFGH